MVNPKQYGFTRNYKDGALSYLSPYISRGVISTKFVLTHIQSLHLPPEETEKFVQELAWRDYWQLVWKEKRDLISKDLKNPQQSVRQQGLAQSIVDAQTGIEAIDEAIETLYQKGYMHNHMRMYVASLAANIAKTHWLEPARWMYYHLLDGDWASNALSWQWVAGTFSSKKYFANQENINRYFYSQQRKSYLDVPYDSFDELEVPKELIDITPLTLNTQLPESTWSSNLLHDKVFIYTYYQLDPFWHAGDSGRRILLLEPSFFNNYPVSQKCLEFALELAKNIPNLEIYTGEFDALVNDLNPTELYYKEHPAFNRNFGIEEPRDWMSPVEGYYPSFFSYWKKAKKHI